MQPPVKELIPARRLPLTSARGLDLSGTLEGAGGIGGLLARYRHGTGSPYAVNGASFYHADGNGNVTYLASSTGGADAAYRYDPFGRWLAETGPYATANGMRFSSKPWIAHNGSNTDGLYYYGYRFYDPNLQRWPNRDPIEEAGGLNLYGFVGNNPLTRFDALGLQWPGYTDWPQKPPPKPSKYPKGFALCQRNIQKDGSCDCPAIFANAIGGEHAYMQHVDDDGNKWGYGFGEAGTAPEKHFDPNSCKPCKKTGGTLKHGTGSGKTGRAATDDEIKDCIKNHPPSKKYKAWGKNRYNCKDWAKEAAANCGLDCN